MAPHGTASRHTDNRGSRSPTFPLVNMAALAVTVGISRAQVSRILNGKCKNPNLDVVMGMARELGITVEELKGKIETAARTLKLKGNAVKEKETVIGNG